MASAPFARTRNSCSDCDTDIFNATYNPATNQMAKIGSQTPAYDADGNVLNDFLNTYSWDAYGRPIMVNNTAITYDALGRAVELNAAGVYTQIQYSPTGFKLAELQGSNYKAFLPMPGGTTEIWQSPGASPYYRHADWLGSSRLASTTSRTVYYDGAYGPFGEPYAGSGTTDLNFTGMNQDTAPNVYDFPAREYGIQGRWPSPDCRGPQRGGFARWGGGPAGLAAVNPMDPQTWNRYAYVRNSPLELTDPTGLHPDCRDGKGCPGPCQLAGNSGATAKCANNDCRGVVYEGDSLYHWRRDLKFVCNGNSTDCKLEHDWLEWATFIDPNVWYGSPVLGDVYIGDIAHQLATAVSQRVSTAGVLELYGMSVLGGVTDPVLSDAARGPWESTLFGRNGGFLNSNPWLRIGYGWFKEEGSNVFRVTGRLVNGAHLLNWPWP